MDGNTERKRGVQQASADGGPTEKDSFPGQLNR
jgi:hypothetical protein